MQITVITPTEKTFEENDYNSFLTILIDNKRKFNVFEGEMQDNNLSRNFSDCYAIVELMKLAYIAGKHGEEFSLIEQKE